MSLSCTIYEILSVIFQNLKMWHDQEHISFGGNLSLDVNVNLLTKFELPSLTHYTNIIGAPKYKNGSCDPDHANLRVVCHPKVNT